MYIRTATFKIDKNQLDQFVAEGEAVKSKLAAIDGNQSTYIGIQEDGTGIAVGIWDSEETARSGQDEIQSIWKSFSSYLKEPVSFTGYKTSEQLL